MTGAVIFADEPPSLLFGESAEEKADATMSHASCQQQEIMLGLPLLQVSELIYNSTPKHCHE